jgi:hypothetical protein
VIGQLRPEGPQRNVGLGLLSFLEEVTAIQRWDCFRILTSLSIPADRFHDHAVSITGDWRSQQLRRGMPKSPHHPVNNDL